MCLLAALKYDFFDLHFFKVIFVAWVKYSARFHKLDNLCDVLIYF